MHPEIQDELQQISLFLKNFWAEACVEQTWRSGLNLFFSLLTVAKCNHTWLFYCDDL